VMPRRAYRRTVESHAKLSVLFSSNRGRQADARFVALFTPLPQNRKSQFNGVLDTATSPPSPHSAKGQGRLPAQHSIIDAPTANDRTGRSGTREHTVGVRLIIAVLR
jgi:hypothetical protein